MATLAKNLTHAAERQFMSVLADGLYKKVSKAEDRTAAIMDIADVAEMFYGKGIKKSPLNG